ncbi:hypothetical protein COCSADRAFT_355650 [Bipolaris sorokiniana ND90Pr]|uniref:Uncharacterized protein n=1 Tax=Cochliobolus sativus (strain ND90Pr / ATCC 201652) TaxID=665912 RepID=M2S708_COCSN|nr:uncharacterized protein COCSADRAFT_355650 [Bipolaris sorokiniana ND90Pr]EMD58150.1 hypothetical protein COCSADRAFT_355650 [Bipolaris sorokiniana ND90Pr]
MDCNYTESENTLIYYQRRLKQINSELDKIKSLLYPLATARNREAAAAWAVELGKHGLQYCTAADIERSLSSSAKDLQCITACPASEAEHVQLDSTKKPTSCLILANISRDPQPSSTASVSNAPDNVQEQGGSLSPVCDSSYCHRSLGEEVAESLSCQTAQAVVSQWVTQEPPYELESQTRLRCVGLAELQLSEADESFDERRASASASGQQVICSSPTTVFYRGLQIVVLEGFSQYADMLVRNQKTAIDQGLIYRVNEPTQTYIVGWLGLPVQMACVQLVLPSGSTQNLEKIPATPICLVKKHDLVRAGLVLVPLRTCWRLSRSGSRWIDLTSLEESYRQFLEEYVISVSLENPLVNDQQLILRRFCLNAVDHYATNVAEHSRSCDGC